MTISGMTRIAWDGIPYDPSTIIPMPGDPNTVHGPGWLLADSAGTTIFLIFTSRIDKLDTATGEVTSWVESDDFIGNDGNLDSAVIDGDDNLYVAYSEPNHIVKVEPDGTVTLDWAEITDFTDIIRDFVIAPSGTLYMIVADYVGWTNPGHLAKIAMDGTVTEPWTSWEVDDFDYCQLAVDASNNVYVSKIDTDFIVDKISSGGTITSDWATSAIGTFTSDMKFDASGDLWIVANGSTFGSRLVKITSAAVITDSALDFGDYTKYLYVNPDDDFIVFDSGDGRPLQRVKNPEMTLERYVPARSFYLQSESIAFDSTGNLYTSVAEGLVKVVPH